MTDTFERYLGRLTHQLPYAPDLSGGDAPEWMTAAACASVDPDLFYPEKGDSSRAAKAVCDACPVKAECLAYALEHGERYGIWAGTSEKERRKLKRRQNRGTGTARVQHTCGTANAYHAHINRGEVPDAACRRASAEKRAEQRREAARTGAA